MNQSQQIIKALKESGSLSSLGKVPNTGADPQRLRRRRRKHQPSYPVGKK